MCSTYECPAKLSFTLAMKSLNSCILKTNHETKRDSVFERSQLTTPIFFFLELETGSVMVPEESLMNPSQLAFLPASMKHIGTARPSPKAFFKSFGVLVFLFFGNRNSPNHTILYSQPIWVLLFSKTKIVDTQVLLFSVCGRRRRILCNLLYSSSSKITFFSGLQGHPKDWEKDHWDDQQCTG